MEAVECNPHNAEEEDIFLSTDNKDNYFKFFLNLSSKVILF